MYFTVFLAVFVIARVYKVYAFDGSLTLATFLIWNYYVISLQLCWDRYGEKKTDSLENSEEPNDSFKKEGSEFQYFDNKFEVEFSKHEHNGKEKKEESFNNLVFDNNMLGNNYKSQETVENFEGIKEIKPIVPSNTWQVNQVNDKDETFNEEFEPEGQFYQPFEDEEEHPKDDKKFV